MLFPKHFSRSVTGTALLVAMIAGPRVFGAATVTSSTAAATSTSTAPVSSGGGFDPSPRTVRAWLTSVDQTHHSLVLTQMGGQKIEITIPSSVVVFSAKRQSVSLDELQPGTTFQVRYRPLTMDAIEIHQASGN